ncbi:MAG: TetR/AcrR family transcriptional regulator [Acidimicrobiia bacterium]|nr:TetR/AcrR family transcriptional regulator [Acidimicrobiia bacterium]
MAKVKGNTRRDKALATRGRIIAAAETEFAAHGYHGATVVDIATRAGVAPQTVYFTFNTKAKLMSAVIDHAVMGDEPQLPETTDWWSAMIAEPSSELALGHFVRGAGPLLARASLMSEILRAAALTDDEVRETHEIHERMRRDAYRKVVEILSEKAPLKAGLTTETATDILFVILGDSLYQLMTTQLGWTHDRLIEWLDDTLPGLLFELGAGA